MEKCIYCEGVYELEESDSNIPKACCSKECEEKYKKAIENIQFVD